MDKDRSNKRGTRPYAKPQLRCVELSTEEVLAKGCKLDTGGSNVADPTSCGVGNGCVLADS